MDITIAIICAWVGGFCLGVWAGAHIQARTKFFVYEAKPMPKKQMNFKLADETRKRIALLVASGACLNATDVIERAIADYYNARQAGKPRIIWPENAGGPDRGLDN